MAPAQRAQWPVAHAGPATAARAVGHLAALVQRHSPAAARGRAGGHPARLPRRPVDVRDGRARGQQRRPADGAGGRPGPAAARHPAHGGAGHAGRDARGQPRPRRPARPRLRALRRLVPGPMSAAAPPVVRPAVGGKAVELLSQALLITAVPAALGPGDYGTLALMLGVATVASAALALGGPAAVSLLVSAAPADRRIATARRLALRGLAWRELAVAIALAVALAAGAPTGAALLLGLAAALDGVATSAAQATLAAGEPWGFSLRWPVQNVALVVAALALQPENAT